MEWSWLPTQMQSSPLSFLWLLYSISHVASSCRSSNTVESWIEENLGKGRETKSKLIGSSGWSSQYIYETEMQDKYFVNTARGVDERMFKGEALELQAMYSEF